MYAPPLISVVMITYGHEEYIKEALKGVLGQKCNYSFEVIIANDASPDTTDAIIKRELAAYDGPVPVRYFCHTANKGMAVNFGWALAKATGKYIAFCEGDDFWTDPYKLQKQVAFLERNPNYALCYHNVWFLSKGKYQLKNHIGTDKTKTVKDLVAGNSVNTASAVVRRSALDFNFMQERGVMFCDYSLFLFAASTGDMYYMKEPMSVYRYHDTSFCSAQSPKQQLKWSISVFDSIEGIFSEELNRLLRETRNRWVKYYMLDSLSDDKLFNELYKEYVASEKEFPYDNPGSYKKTLQELQQQLNVEIPQINSFKKKTRSISNKVLDKVYLRLTGKWKS